MEGGSDANARQPTESGEGPAASPTETMLSRADRAAGNMKWRLDQWMSQALYRDPNFRIEISTGPDEFLIRLNRR